MRALAALAILAITAAPVAAAAAEPPCLTPAEFTALSSYALPSIITGTAQRCAASLPPGAWLKQNGEQLASRFAENKQALWPSAKVAFVKLSSSSSSGAAGVFKALPDSSLQPMLDALIEGMVSQGKQIEPQRCAMIDRIARLLAPLPPENTAELISLAVAWTGKDKIDGFNLCPA